MRPEDRDAGYLWDMLDAARTVRDFTTGLGLDEYRADRKLQLAVERAIEIIGEAARLVSASFKEQHPEIPWQQIIAQRTYWLTITGRSVTIASGSWLRGGYRISSINWNPSCLRRQPTTMAGRSLAARSPSGNPTWCTSSCRGTSVYVGDYWTRELLPLSEINKEVFRGE